jgi:hypothetical protein
MCHQLAVQEAGKKSPADLKQLRKQLLRMIIQNEQTRQVNKPR